MGKLVIESIEKKINLKKIEKAVYAVLGQKAKLKAELVFASAEGEKIRGNWRQLYNSKDCLVWVDESRGKVWRLSDGKMESWLDFDFGDKEWSDEVLLSGGFLYNESTKVSGISNFYVYGDNIHFEYAYTKKLYNLYYNLKTGDYYNVDFMSCATPKPYYKQPQAMWQKAAISQLQP